MKIEFGIYYDETVKAVGSALLEKLIDLACALVMYEK